jgi:hypothetical protein
MQRELRRRATGSGKDHTEHHLAGDGSGAWLKRSLTWLGTRSDCDDKARRVACVLLSHLQCSLLGISSNPSQVQRRCSTNGRAPTAPTRLYLIMHCAPMFLAKVVWRSILSDGIYRIGNLRTAALVRIIFLKQSYLAHIGRRSALMDLVSQLPNPMQWFVEGLFFSRKLLRASL